MSRRILWVNTALVVLVVAIGVGAYLWLFAPEPAVSTGRTVAVRTGTVTETVTATGTVETAGTVELAFTTAGTVDAVKVAEGDRVRAGRIVATLDDTAARQGVVSARNSYQQATTAYVQAVSGSSGTALSLSAAEQALVDARENARLGREGYALTVSQAAATLADARSAWSATCLDPAGACPDTDAWAQLRTAEGEVTSARTAYDQALQTASADETADNLKLNQSSVSMADAQAKQNSACTTFGGSSTQCTSAVSATLAAQQQHELLTATTAAAAQQRQQALVNADARITAANVALRRLQATLATQAQDAIAAARDALASARLAKEKGLAADQQAIEHAREALAAERASAAAVDTAAGAVTPGQASIDAARSGVDLARSGIAVARESLDRTTLRAPVAGTVASVTAVEDQAAQAGTAVVTLIPKASYQVVADFSEADATKVLVGQEATVTFDALADGAATATVTAVDILPTTGASVTTYGVTLTLGDVPDGLRDGMSASVVVTVDEATDVLWAPTAAITTAGGLSTVTVVRDGVEATVEVATGLTGDAGTEITGGVAEGDQLVVSATDSGSAAGGFPMGGIPGGAAMPGGAPPAGGRAP